MSDDDRDQPRRAAAHRVGEPLDDLSVEEIGDRIALLEGEIARLEAERAAKTAARDAAGAIFKP